MAGNEIEKKKAEVAVADMSEQELLDKVLAERDPAEMKKYYDLFNVLQSKKDIIRTAKMNDVLDVAVDQAAERFENCSDNMTNKEIIDYMNVLQGHIQQNMKNLKDTAQAPMIQINANELNINSEASAKTLSKESRNNVLTAIKEIMDAANKTTDDNIIDVEDTTEEKTENDD